MKTISTLVAALLLTTASQAQTQYDYLGGYKLKTNLPSPGCFFFDVEQESVQIQVHDVKFVFGNGYISFESLYIDSVKMPIRMEGQYAMWDDCERNLSYSQNVVFLIKDGHSLELGSHVLPFRKGNQYGYFVVNVVEDGIIIRGHKLNAGDDQFECYDLSPTLGLEELSTEALKFVDYNTLGQAVNEDFKGVVIRVYSNGVSDRIFKQ